MAVSKEQEWLHSGANGIKKAIALGSETFAPQTIALVHFLKCAYDILIFNVTFFAALLYLAVAFAVMATFTLKVPVA